ncbi:MAG TPA: hypothetical protein VFI45_22395 [Candidatus Acidoferrum sp.]|nr:hypothetical protein [Candidatus Acidoferrum sp.]
MGVDLGSKNSLFPFDELNSSSHLFLTKIYEPKVNCLRLIIREGKTSKFPVPINIDGADLGEGFPVEIDDSCATFQIDWNNYVLYQVLNESFGMPADAGEIYQGKLARTYSVSRLLRFVIETTQATNEYPGRLLHYEVICEDHVVNVICVEPPQCLKSALSPRVQ